MINFDKDFIDSWPYIIYKHKNKNELMIVDYWTTEDEHEYRELDDFNSWITFNL